MPCVYLPGPAPAVTVANNYNWVMKAAFCNRPPRGMLSSAPVVHIISEWHLGDISSTLGMSCYR